MQPAYTACQPQGWNVGVGNGFSKHGNKKRKISTGAAMMKYPYTIQHPPQVGVQNPYAAWVHNHQAQMPLAPYANMATMNGTTMPYSGPRPGLPSAYSRGPSGFPHVHGAILHYSYPPQSHSPYNPEPNVHGMHTSSDHHVRHVQSDNMSGSFQVSSGSNKLNIDSSPASNDQSQGYFEFTAGNGPPHEVELSEDDEEYCEYTRPCSYVGKDLEVDKNLSIGVVLLRTARPSNTALPATWTEANPDPTLPIPTVLYEADKCPSHYHSKSCKDDTLQPVRQSTTWDAVKQDPIFSTFSSTTSGIIPRAKLLEIYAMRHDPIWESARRILGQGSSAYRSSAQPTIPKKRIFSQTEHAIADGANKRHRDDSSPSNASHRHDLEQHNGRTDASGRHRGRTLKDHRRLTQSGANKSQEATSKIFINGHLMSRSSDDNAQADSSSSSVITAGLDDKTPASIPVISSPDALSVDSTAGNATDNASDVGRHAQSISAETSASNPLSAEHEAKVDQAANADKQPAVKESAWTRLARQYQEDVNRDFGMMDEPYE